MTSNTLLQWGLETTAFVSALIIFVLLVRKPVANRFGAQAALWLWSLPAARLFMPPRPVAGDATITAAASPANPTLMTFDASLAAPNLAASSSPLEVSAPLFTSGTLMMLGLFLWVAGTLAYLTKRLLDSRTWWRAVQQETIETPDTVLRLTGELCRQRRIQTAPSVVMSKAAEAPQIIGALRPRIVLPTDFCERYSPQEQRMALLHELIHYQHADLVAAWLATLAASIQWFNPLAHKAVAQFRIDQEAACDEAVRRHGVGCREYAETLLKTARLNLTPATALTLNHGLHDRLRRMATPMPSRLLAIAAGTSIAGLSVLGAVATAGTYQDEPQPSDTAETKTERRIEKVIVRRMEGDASEKSTFVFNSGDIKRIEIRHDSDDTGFLLVGDPFGSMTPPVKPKIDAPDAPTPPTPPKASEVTPPPPPQPVEGGTWMFIPTPPDMSEFEKEVEIEMRAFADQMGSFEIAMAGFGEEMGAFGEKMGKVGETIGTLATTCSDNEKKPGKPTLLTEDHPITAGEKIKALCFHPDDAHNDGASLIKFVKSRRALSDTEKEGLVAAIRDF